MMMSRRNSRFIREQPSTRSSLGFFSVKQPFPVRVRTTRQLPLSLQRRTRSAAASMDDASLEKALLLEVGRPANVRPPASLSPLVCVKKDKGNFDARARQLPIPITAPSSPHSLSPSSRVARVPSRDADTCHVLPPVRAWRVIALRRSTCRVPVLLTRRSPRAMRSSQTSSRRRAGWSTRR